MSQSRPLFVYFRLFHMTQFKHKLMIALMVCLGLEPGAAGWKVQTNPLSYTGTPNCCVDLELVNLIRCPFINSFVDQFRIRINLCFMLVNSVSYLHIHTIQFETITTRT